MRFLILAAIIWGSSFPVITYALRDISPFLFLFVRFLLAFIILFPRRNIVEDEDVAEITVSAALLRRYKRNLDAYCGGLREFCVRRGMMHISIDTKTDLDTLLLDYLRKRGLLK